MKDRLTTSQAAERLGVAQPTVKAWCRRGLFPNAEIEETPRGPLWLIPEGDIVNFTPPKMGRPLKAKDNGKPARKRATKKGSKK
jgi:hypothetical protein